MKFVVEEVKEFGVLPEETIIGVEVQDITLVDVKGKNGGEDWQKLNFKFIIRDLPGELASQEEYAAMIGGPIWGSVSAKLTEHADNKLRQWAVALLNMGELGAGFELDTDLLLGRSARAVTSQYAKRDGTGFRQSVAGLLPPAPLATANPLANMAMATSAPATTAPATTPADPWDEPPF